MNEIYGYSESFKLLCNRRKQLVGVDAEKANFCNQPLYSMLVYSLGSLQSNLFCSKAKPCRTTKEKFFNRNNTAQISQSLPFAEKSNFCIPPLCSMFVSFLPLSFQSNLLCSKAKPCGNTKETTAQISQSLPDSKTSSHCSRLDKCISQGKLSFLARPLRTDIETFQHEKSD